MALIKNIDLTEYYRIGKSEFKNVSIYQNVKNKRAYKAQLTTSITGYKWVAFFTDERECAKNVDIQLIKQGKEPVNILKRKKI